MSAVSSGILYPIRLNVPGLMADLRQAETAIQSHVARMSSLKIVIPVTFAMPAGMPGGTGGIVNNVLNSSTFNTSNNNAVTNYYNTVTNTINQQAAAATRATHSATQGIAGLHRFHRQMMAMMVAVESVNAVTDVGKAIYYNQFGTLKQSQDAVSAAQKDIREIPIVGRPASMLGENIYRAISSVKNAAFGGKLESDKGYLERAEAEGGVIQQRVERTEKFSHEGQQLAMHLRGGAEAAEDTSARSLAVTPWERQQNRVAELKRQKERAQRSFEETDPQIRTAQATEANAREQRAMAQNIANVQAGFQIQLGRQQQERGEVIQELRFSNSGDMANARRAKFSASMTREREEARGQGPAALAEFEGSIEPEKKKQFENKERRDREQQEAESADKITEIKAKASQAQLRQAGQDQQAELAAFDQGQSQIISKLNEEISHEEANEQKRRLIAQREAQIDAQKVERLAFVAEQARKFMAEEESAANHLAATRASAAEYALHAEGKTYEEGEARFKESWDARIRDEQAAVDKTISGSPERRRAEAQLAATQAERGQAEAARNTDEAMDFRQRQSQIGQTTLRSRGQDYTAQLKGIADKAQQEYDAAAGNAGKQALIRQQEKADLEQEQYEIKQKVATGQAVVGSRTDLTGKYSGADKMEDLLQVNRNIETILKSINGQLIPKAQ